MCVVEKGAGEWKDGFISMENVAFFNYWVQNCQTNHVVPKHTHKHLWTHNGAFTAYIILHEKLKKKKTAKELKEFS